MKSEVVFPQLIPKFLLSGGLATAAHWLLMAWLVSLSVAATLATAAGATFGAMINYLLQYYVSFRCREPHRLVLPVYLQSCGVGWLANLSLFYLLQHTLIIHAVWAQLLTTTLVTGLNFLFYQKVVFHERRRT